MLGLSRRVVTVGGLTSCMWSLLVAARGISSLAPGGAGAVAPGLRVGDWTCSCGFTNFSFRKQCFQCHQSVGLDGAGVPTSSPSAAGLTIEDALPMADEAPSTSDYGLEGRHSVQPYKNGDWTCQCGTHNFARRHQCMTCGQVRTHDSATVFHNSTRGHRNASSPATSLATPRAGDWMCPSCSAHNFSYREKCFGCNEPRAGGALPIPGTPLESAAAGAGGVWICPDCHTSNGPTLSRCSVCDMAQPQPTRGSHQGGISGGGSVHPGAFGNAPFVKRAGDWSCPQCGFYNFSSRDKCRMCKCAKSYVATTPASSGTAAPDSGTFPKISSGRAGRANDWVCACGYRNYADRASCRECGVSRQTEPAE